MSSEQTFKEVVKTLSDMVNKMSFDYQMESSLFALALYREHRTLQQSIIRLLDNTIREYSALCKKNGVDARNESAFKWAQEVEKIESIFPYI